MTLIFLVIFILLLGLSAFFSMSETALVSLSPQKAKALSLNKPDTAKELARWLRQPHELLTLILVGNTMVNVMFASLLTAFAFRTFPGYHQGWIETGSWLVSSFVLVLFGEIVPKLLARSIPEKLSVFTLYWLSRLRLISMPLINMVAHLLKLLSISIHKPSLMDEKKSLTLEELKILLEEGEQHPTMRVNESMSMMRKALELHQRKIDDIMTPLEKMDVVEIDPQGKPIRDTGLIVDLVIEKGHTRTPIKKAGRIMGFLHTKDLLSLLVQKPTPNLTSFIRQPLDLKLGTPVVDLLDRFKNSGIHIGFVYNTLGQIVGLVTLEDILEEITGEILDEYDLVA